MKKQRTHFCFSQVTSLALAASLSISAASGMTALAAEPVEVVPVEAVEVVEVLPEAVIEAEEVESSFEAGMAVSPGVNLNYFSDQTYSFTKGLPWNTSELAQIVDYENPASVAACVVAAFVRATDNFNDGNAMIRKLYEPKSAFGVTHAPSGFDSIFTTHLNESYRKWVPRSYFEGGTPYNGYTPTRPWTINLTYNSFKTDEYRNTPSVGGLGIEPIVYTIKSKAQMGSTTVNIILYRYPEDSRWYAHSFEGLMSRGVEPTTEGSNDDGFTHGGGGSDDPTPVIETGWKKVNKGYMYVRADGSMPKNKWEKIGGVYYHFDAEGYMQTGWFKEGKKWYYLKSSGAMATGWLKISGKYYYFNSSGVMQSNAWVKSGGKWYYMNSSGVMATGWQKIGGKYYYFNSSGVMQSNAWVKSGGKWYYMDSSGVMVAGTSKKIGKKTYRFNASGVCLNP